MWTYLSVFFWSIFTYDKPTMSEWIRILAELLLTKPLGLWIGKFVELTYVGIMAVGICKPTLPMLDAN